MSHNCAYVRQHYQVPAEVGRRVIAYGKPGIILADRGHYIGVVLDEDPKKRISNYHPTHEMQYGEMAESLPLKEWQVMTAKCYDWFDVTHDLGGARHYVERVWAATASQAKYQAYKRLEDCFDSAKAMCFFKVRRY
jgi:molybdopterin synthase catalytic subunit